MSIPKGWEEVTIGEICEKSFYGTSDATTDSGKYPVIKMNHMQNGGLILKDMSYIDYDEKTFNKYKLYKGDILLNRTNSYELVGKVSLFDLDGDYLTASYLVALRLNREKANPKFINEVLNTKKMQDKIRVYVTKGVSQANINPTIFKQHIKVPLPPLKEQEKIAEILSSCDEHIKNLKNLKSELEKEKLHLMNELLSGKTRFANFTTPWQEVTLAEIADIYQPKTIPQSSFTESGFLVYGANGVIGYYDEYNHEQPQIAVACRGNTCGVVNFTKPKSWITGNAMVVNVDNYNNVNKEFLYQKLSNENFAYLITGSGQPQITSNIKNHKIKLPSLEEQKKIGEVLSACDERLECLNELITAQTTLKSHLLTELLTGNLRVKI